MTGLTRAAERLMAMTDATWARHANPWSFYTRILILPALAFAIYARVFIGWWCRLVPVALLAAWTFINPRAFAPPKSFDSYASRGVLGERVYLDRTRRPIPAHHSRAAAILTAVSLVGAVILVYGLIVLDPWATVAGVVLTVGGKLWFVDRMVWLFSEADGARFIP